jgi:hypothetical protein
MAVQKEIWVKYIIKRFWKDNQFLKFMSNDDDYVLAGKVVHIPNPGTKPLVTKNRSSFPGTIVRRADTDITYNLDEYTTDPTHIVDADKVELSYDKIGDVFGDHAGQLVETIADDMIVKYLTAIAAANVIKSTGAAAAAKITGQTTTRKVLLEADVKKAKLLFDLQNVPSTERYMMLESNQMDELTTSLGQTQYRDFSEYMDAKEGIVGRLHGFNIMQRSSVAIMTSADVVKAIGSAVAATDNVAGLAWQKGSLARALGEKKFFENPNRAEYYGDIYSALLRAGGRVRREDASGVAAIVNAA